MVREVVVNRAKRYLTETEADAAHGNKDGQKHCAATRGETAREPCPCRVKDILTETPRCQNDKHNKVETAQSKKRRQVTVQSTLIIGKRTEQGRKKKSEAFPAG